MKPSLNVLIHHAPVTKPQHLVLERGLARLMGEPTPLTEADMVVIRQNFPGLTAVSLLDAMTSTISRVDESIDGVIDVAMNEGTPVFLLQNRGARTENLQVLHEPTAVALITVLLASRRTALLERAGKITVEPSADFMGKFGEMVEMTTPHFFRLRGILLGEMMGDTLTRFVQRMCLNDEDPRHPAYAFGSKGLPVRVTRFIKDLGPDVYKGNLAVFMTEEGEKTLSPTRDLFFSVKHKALHNDLMGLSLQTEVQSLSTGVDSEAYP